jgi:MoxR-like ATPase
MNITRTPHLDPRNGEVRLPDSTPRITTVTARDVATLDDVQGLFKAIGGCLRARLQGCDEVIAQLLTAVFADGHVLLESQPGGGKTEMAATLGRVIMRDATGPDYAAYRRIQFTPDLLPSDVTGVTLFDAATRAFVFRPGPVFANVVLADEINRTSPKVQAALLEAMAEKQVTVDNETHRLEELFVVLATQNPVDRHGTYPLPRAQLDRFLFKLKVPPLPREKLVEVLAKRHTRPAAPQLAVAPDAVLRSRRILADAVRVSPAIHECLADVCEALRKDRRVLLGISTRALVLAVPALQAWAMLHGRDYVTPRDLKALAAPLFSHRLKLTPGVPDADAVVAECVAPVVEAYTRKTLSR